MPSGNAYAVPPPLKPTLSPSKPNTNIPRNTTTTTANQACAACKHQRRKCAPDCLLAPYFPHDRHRHFLNAHKLFGVSNITKIIKFLSPPEKDAAMRSIIFQSDARANDPVGGCYRIIKELQYQIEYTRAELEIVLQQLAICRERARQESHMQLQETEDLTSFSSSCDLNNSMPYNYDLHVNEQQQQQQQQYCSSGSFNTLQEDMWCLQIQDSSPVNMKPSFIDECEDAKVEVSSESQGQVEFEQDGFVDRNLNMASAQLIISS